MLNCVVITLLLADRATCHSVLTLCHRATPCIFNWTHFHPSWVHAMSLTKGFFFLSTLEIAWGLATNSLGRMSISSPALSPRVSVCVTRRALRCEWVGRADFSCLISSAPGKFLIANMPWSYFWLVCKQLLICGQELSSWPKGTHAGAIGVGVSCATARQGGKRAVEKWCLLSLCRFSVHSFSFCNVDSWNCLFA